jgi:hypothetical protein
MQVAMRGGRGVAFWNDRFALIFVSLWARVSYERLLKRWDIFNKLRALTDKRRVGRFHRAVNGWRQSKPN